MIATMAAGRPYGTRDAREREYVPPVVDDKRRNKVRLPAMVPPDIHELAHRSARAAGISASRYVAELIARDTRDADGRPLWADDLQSAQEELPMTG